MISIQGVSKQYSLYNRPIDRAIEALSPTKHIRHQEFWALRDVTLHVGKGEVVGIIGGNGSGKSTLLQIVSGIVQPTSGRVYTEGRIAALLELGTGFNPEFTGRENVYINSEILGVPRAQTEMQFAGIDAFAGIGPFMERPVKEYSTGMYVRLAFATAIHVAPDILIVDEALAVGDAVFANRCIRKLDELRGAGVTILFVSHDLGLVKRLADRVLLLEGGRVAHVGTAADVVNDYVGRVHQAESRSSGVVDEHYPGRHGDGVSRISSLRLLDQSGEASAAIHTGALVTVEITVEVQSELPELMVGFLVRNRLGTDVFGTNTILEGIELGSFQAGERCTVRFCFPTLLVRQEYTLTVAAQYLDGHSQDWWDDALAFTVLDTVDAAGLLRISTDVTWERSGANTVR